MMLCMVMGSLKLQEPTCTAEAPAIRYSTASRHEAMPPQAVNALDHNRAQLTDREAVGIVFKIIIGAGGGHDGVFEHRAAQLHG